VYQAQLGRKTTVRIGLGTGFVVGVLAYWSDHRLRDFSLKGLLITVLATTVLGVPAVFLVERIRRFVRRRSSHMAP
jgi:hypothetical protein